MTTHRVYAGIGSRRAPSDVLDLCTRIARRLCDAGWIMRSGHAIGCDQAFEKGAHGRAEVYLPWRDFESDVRIHTAHTRVVPSSRALEMVSTFHPAPQRLSMAGLRLMARNAHIILGTRLDDPVLEVICWTPDEERGGTAATLRLARKCGVKVSNLADPKVRQTFEAALAAVD